ncbi:TPA: type III restriction endonuclease subunit R, partial [Escherichia coli]|nr:type III restriction endonuclease subunit R [Escherichia coli]EFE0695354.1 type III restriction endonuclease subunit R [Escherichia coli]EFF9397023.1 type III restriction endonuclease subunit R [Escherichia coli]EFK3694527.1 type III restriction endonuclease subunit R [Escherichia coli]EFM3263876.1 type III restriction endonuclease subunit R [Escherichia coli]
AGNFYPDFLLWLVDDKSGKQWLSLIDPKGIRNLNLDDPKFGLYKEIKNLEHKLSDDNLSLSAFIVSETCYVDLVNVPDSKENLEARNVLFIEDTGSLYLEKLFSKMVSE